MEQLTRWRLNGYENFAVTVKLEPGEAYEKTLSMLLLVGEPKEKVSFKMGFTPIGSKETYWSNEITLQVQPVAKANDKPKDAEGDKDNTKLPKKQEGGKEVKGLVALAELVEQPAKGLFEVRLSLKNVSDKAITICYCPYLSQNQVQWIGPDGKMRTSKHNNWPPSNFILTKDYFVGIQPGEVRHIVPTIRFHAATETPVDGPVRKDLGYWDQVDQEGSGDRSNLARAGEHRVTVSFNNVTVGYPVGRGPQGRPGAEQAVENVWTGTVTAKEVTFKLK